MAATPLLDLTRALTTDPATKAAFRDDPDGFLASHGHPDLDPDELATAVIHASEALPAPLALALGSVADVGADVLDVLRGVADLDADEALLRWDALTGHEASLEGLDDPADLDDQADLDGQADPAGGFAPVREDLDDDDLADLDDLDLGGFAPAVGRGGLAPAHDGDEDATFGSGAGTKAGGGTLDDLAHEIDDPFGGTGSDLDSWSDDHDDPFAELNPFGSPAPPQEIGHDDVDDPGDDVDPDPG